MSPLFIYLGFALSAVFGFFWLKDLRSALNVDGGFRVFLRSARARETIVFFLILAVPILFVNMSGYGGSLQPTSSGTLWLISLGFAFFVSLFWYLYISWLDIFEKEHIVAIIATFVMASLSVFLVWPISGAINFLGFDLNGDPWNDWWYCVVGIGLVEEIVKIIPFLIMLRFTKQINEPFDYILYGSICALGFAFVENTLYLYRSNLEAIHARTLYASLAHMFFSSLITYGMAIARFRRPEFRKWAFPVMLVIASLAHGFYDFWLINRAFYLPIVTTVFFIVSMHLWVVMKNNLVNISPFFDASIKIDGRKIRYRIINGLLAIFYAAYVIQFLMSDTASANSSLQDAWLWNVYILLFIAMNFGSHEVIKGYISPLFDFKHTWRVLAPRIYFKGNKSGLKIELKQVHNPAQISQEVRSQFPLTGSLQRRIIFLDDNDCYLFQTIKPFYFNNEPQHVLLLKNNSKEYEFDDNHPHFMKLYTLINRSDLPTGQVKEENTLLVADTIGIAIGKGS